MEMFILWYEGLFIILLLTQIIGVSLLVELSKVNVSEPRGFLWILPLLYTLMFLLCVHRHEPIRVNTTSVACSHDQNGWVAFSFTLEGVAESVYVQHHHPVDGRRLSWIDNGWTLMYLNVTYSGTHYSSYYTISVLLVRFLDPSFILHILPASPLLIPPKHTTNGTWHSMC